MCVEANQVILGLSKSYSARMYSHGPCKFCTICQIFILGQLKFTFFGLERFVAPGQLLMKPDHPAVKLPHRNPPPQN